MGQGMGHHRCSARVVTSNRGEGLSLRRCKVTGSSVCDDKGRQITPRLSPQPWYPSQELWLAIPLSFCLCLSEELKVG